MIPRASCQESPLSHSTRILFQHDLELWLPVENGMGVDMVALRLITRVLHLHGAATLWLYKDSELMQSNPGKD
jgi:hypothetical protein